jgi:hypothetical protein
MRSLSLLDDLLDRQQGCIGPVTARRAAACPA